jgi:hypothetical protein
MTVVPWIAAAVSLAFAVHLLVRFVRRGRWAEGAWAVALFMYAAASAALALGLGDGWSSAEFRTYWLFGAVLNVPYLAVGEIYLLARRPRVGHVALVVLLGATAYATLEVRNAGLDARVLASREFFTGKEVLGEEATARILALVYSYAGTAVLVLGILWSALGMRGKPHLRGRLYGVSLILLGALVVAGGSAFAATGNATGFSFTLAAGVAVMYWGFLVSTRPSPVPDQGAGQG